MKKTRCILFVVRVITPQNFNYRTIRIMKSSYEHNSQWILFMKQFFAEYYMTIWVWTNLVQKGTASSFPLKPEWMLVRICMLVINIGADDSEVISTSIVIENETCIMILFPKGIDVIKVIIIQYFKIDFKDTSFSITYYESSFLKNREEHCIPSYFLF